VHINTAAGPGMLMRPAGHEAKAEARKSEAEAHMGLKALTSLS